MRHKRAYRYRCYPTQEQQRILARTFGCARFVFNWALHLRTDAYRKRGEHVFYRDTSAALTQLRKHPETAWLGDVAYIPLQQALRHLDKAWRQLLRGESQLPHVQREAGPPVGRVHDFGFYLGWRAIDPCSHE